MAEELEDIKRLPPEERIAKLKELEEKRKKEIEKAQELVRKSVEEITKEEANKYIEEEEETRKEEEEKKKKEIPLEETVIQEEPKLTPEQVEAHKDYVQHLRQETTTKDLYNLAKNIAEDVQESGYLSMQNQGMLSDIERAQQYKKQDIDTGKYKTAGEEITDLLSATKNIVDDIRGKYKR
ncbi:hypothetical protein JXC34_01865 [Candidatus Woesearchaeota archaeon]|nr:hypothetical protein [Candidatus Woesearchaeota archaeon]